MKLLQNDNNMKCKYHYKNLLVTAD